MTKSFILGNPRSGTSLFRLMLNMHPEIVAPPECGFMQWWYNKYENWKFDDLESQLLQSFLDDLFTSKKIETWNLCKNQVKDHIINMQPSNYEELVTIIYLAYSKNPKRIKVIIDKNNYFIKHLNEIQKIWPQAKYIHMIRDGRDVAASYLEVNKIKTNSPYKPILSTYINEIADEWIRNNQQIATLSHNNKQKYMLLKFEDLLINTEKKLVEVCEFLGVDYNSHMLKYYEISNKEPDKTIDWKRKTLEKPDKEKIGRFKKVLSPKQISEFNSIAKRVLEFYGYY